MSTGNTYKHLSFKTIAPFLNPAGRKASKVFSYLGLGLGVLLLLSCVQMFININRLIRDKNPRKDGYDFISITKTITNENMGRDNRFSVADIKEIKDQPFVEDAAPLVSNQFRVKASAGNIIPFSTDLFLESVPDHFLDTLPEAFKWQPGQYDLPIILSAEYLEMYNVFAPSQDLPQLSAATAGAVNIMIECESPMGTHTFKGHVVALSDRISSVLVPQRFLEFANKMFSGVENPPAARVYLKTIDANNPALLDYLQKKNYYVNKDKTKFGRVKQVLQGVVSALAVFSVLVILLAMLLFSFYLQLMISKSKDNLQLLLTLGYSPGWLSKTVSNKWIPVYVGIVCIALLLTQLFQFIFVKSVVLHQNALSPFIHWAVLLNALVLLVLCVWVNHRMVKKELYRLS